MSAAAIARLPRRRFTPEEYLLIERDAEFKSEFFQGEIFAMAGGTPWHGLIGTNTLTLLNNVLRGTGCRGYSSDTRIQTPSPSGVPSFFYPDGSIICGKPKLANLDKQTVTNPVLALEVLSPSTKRYDRVVKAVEYQRVPSMREILLIHQDRPKVELWSRKGAVWTHSLQTKLDGSIEIPHFRSSLLLAEIYGGVAFD